MIDQRLGTHIWFFSLQAKSDFQTFNPMVNLPPDLETNIFSLECGISTRAMIMTFLEIPLSIKMRSPSRIVARFSLFFLCMSKSYQSSIVQANQTG